MYIIRKSKSLDYWKKKLLSILENETISKSFDEITGRLEKAKGYPAGTIREWSGKKYKKLSSGKWMRTYTGTQDRGEKQAIKNVMNKISKASSMDELVNIIKENRERFQGEDGRPLPIVKEFLTVARKTEPGTKSKKEASNTNLQGIKDKYNSGLKLSGDKDDIYVGKEEISGTWKMVEADKPSASHDEKTFNKTEYFPTNPDGSTINDRDYEKDKDAQLAVIDIASEYDGRALSFDSPIVVSTDGVVISGNNRTMSSKIAANKGTDKKYIEALKKRAKKFGFTPEDVSRFKNPRVVFEMDNKGNYSTKEFSKFNETTQKTMNPVESAVKMSKIITTDIVKSVAVKIDEFDTISELYAEKKAVNDVFRSLEIGGLINQFTRPQYVTEDGITGAGKEFLETVLIGSVVNESNIRGLSNNKAIRKKLVRAIVPLIENKAMGGYSVSNELNEAIDIMNQVRASKEISSVEEFAKQSSMFEETNDVSVELAKKLDMKEKDFADFMKTMNGNLEIGASGQADIFFGDVESKEDILNRMLKLGKSIGVRMKYLLRKSKDINYWKKKLLGILKEQSMEKSLREILFGKRLIKSYQVELLQKARGFAVGTIREWNGVKHKKLSSGKWMRTYEGSGSRGEKQAIRNVMSKINSAKTMSELASIIGKNMERFKDENGKTLPVVKEFLTEARGTDAGKKKVKELTWKEKDEISKNRVIKDILPKISDIKLSNNKNKVEFKYKGDDHIISERGVIASKNKINGKTVYGYGGKLNDDLNTRESEALKKLFITGYDRDKQMNIYGIPKETNTISSDKPKTDVIKKEDIKKPNIENFSNEKKNNISFSTKSGNKIELKQDKDSVIVLLNGKENGKLKSKTMSSLKGSKVLSMINTEGKSGFIQVSENSVSKVDDYLKNILKETDDKKKKDLNKIVPGHDELKDAYSKRSQALDERYKYMERGINTSIFSGKNPNVESIEKKIKDLESKYPKAKMYIRWSNSSSSTNSGHQERKAAQALLEGKTIKEAEKISNDYDKWL